MESISLPVYVGALVVLFLKFVVAISVQAKERLGQGAFRWPEDASHWKGEVRPDSDQATRAQQLLRNDGESQPYFVVFGALYVALGIWPAGAPIYFVGYALSRVAHAWWFLRAKQPHRNRAFVASGGILLALVVHVAWAAFASW